MDRFEMITPQYVGSPAMRVIASIPLGDGRQYLCTVAQARGTFGTVHAYRGEDASGNVVWHAGAGHYDFELATDALRDMVFRSGLDTTF